MKAFVWTAYGKPEVLEQKELPKPVPKPDEVLIKLKAASVFPGDCELRALNLQSVLWRVILRLVMGVTKPRGTKILGQELSGVIENVGADITRFKIGDSVFASTDMNFGVYAQYKCLKQNAQMAIKPSSMSFEQAAGVPVGATNALHFLREAAIQPGERVLINGSGGCIGSFGVQLAKIMVLMLPVLMPCPS